MVDFLAGFPRNVSALSARRCDLVCTRQTQVALFALNHFALTDRVPAAPALGIRWHLRQRLHVCYLLAVERHAGGLSR